MTTNGHETGAEIQKTPEQNLRSLITHERTINAIKAVLPKHLTPERIVKVALGTIARTPDLALCTPSSVIAAIVQASEMGLEPGGGLGHAYLVPFRSTRDGRTIWEASLIVGYKGFIALARRSGEIMSIEAHPVFLRDQFVREQGRDPKLVHVPWMPKYSETGAIIGETTPGVMIGVYAVARLRDGGVQVEYMSRADVESIRMRSARGQYDKGPWHDDYTEMARKTVVRRIFKYLPVSIELAGAMERTTEIEGTAEIIEDSGIAAMASLDDGGQRTPDVRTQADTIRERVAAKVQMQAAAPAAQPATATTFDHSPKADDPAPAAEEPAKRTRKRREPAPAATHADPTAVAPPAQSADADLFGDPPAAAAPAEDPLVELRRELSQCETPSQVLLVATGMKAVLTTMPRDDAKLAWKEMISRVEDLGIGDAENWLRDRMDPKRQPAAAPAPAADPGPDPERAAIEAEASDGAEQARLLAALNVMPVFIGGPLQFSKHYARSAATLDRTSREAYRNAARAFLRERFPKAVTSDEGADAWLDDDSTGGAT